MKKIIILLLTLAILAMAGILVVLSSQADDSLPPEEEKKGMHKESEGPKVSKDYRYMNEDEFAALTEQQQEALRALDAKSWEHIGHFCREEQIILGNITEDEPRLDVETAKQVIANFEKGMYEEERLVCLFYSLFPYYDYSGGSGITRTQYWLDDARTAEITVWIEGGMVTYYEYDAEGNIVVEENLYDINPNNN